MKNIKPDVLLLVLASSLLSACGGDQLSSLTDELTPVWLLDADQSTGKTEVSGLVRSRFDDNTSDLERLGIAQLINPDAIAPIDNNSPFANTGIRLSDGDVMKTINAGRRHQLYRRDAVFVYTTQVPLDENQPGHELSLNYKDARFPPSVTSAQVFSVDGFTSPDTTTTVPSTGTINASWSVQALPPNYVQRLGVQLVSCNVNSSGNSRPLSSEQIILPLASGDRSVAIPVAELPPPSLSGQGTQDTTDSTLRSCTYELQLIAINVPVGAFTEDNQLGPPVEGNQEPEVAPIVIRLSRSEKLLFQVDIDASVNTETTP